MLCRYNPIEIERVLRDVPFAPPFPPAADRDAWNAQAERVGAEKVRSLIALAEEAAETAPVPMPATLFLDAKRTGNRVPYEIAMYQHRTPLRDLLVGECLEGRGRFLDPILNYAWAICEESSWAYPAHDPDLPDPARPLYDLGAAMTAWALAELDLLLGDALDPGLRRRIRYEVDRRCITPYLARNDFGWLYNTAGRTVNNWSAVCNGCAMAAAVYLEPDPARQAAVLAKGARSLDDYLATFDVDGGSSEGPGYWTYGFGYYVMTAHLLEHRTQGWMDLFSEPVVAKTASFPLRTVLNGGEFATFSDCDRNPLLVSAMLAYLSRRLSIPDLMPLARVQEERYARLTRSGTASGGHLAKLSGSRRFEVMWAVRDLFWMPDPGPAEYPIPALHDYFREMAWMFARLDPTDPNALALAAKAGHNAEMHNQNDVGSFIVYSNGRSLVADPGRGRYTRQYFGPERYTFLVNSSLGHSTPVPNGQAQAAGRSFAAQVLDYTPGSDCDRFVIEMKGAYPPEANLDSLTRTFLFCRDVPGGQIELVDTFDFAGGPGAFETALITFAGVELSEGCALLRDGPAGLRVTFDPALVAARVEQHDDIDFPEGPGSLRRVVFAAAPAEQGAIRLLIRPE